VQHLHSVKCGPSYARASTGGGKRFSVMTCAGTVQYSPDNLSLKGISFGVRAKKSVTKFNTGSESADVCRVETFWHTKSREPQNAGRDACRLADA
jgi:hypothetical protein